MRLIDADALPAHKAYCVDEAGWGANFYVVDKSDIDDAPTIDAVPVVRCKDCKFYPNHAKRDVVFDSDACHWNADEQPDPDDYCSAGERRSDD